MMQHCFVALKGQSRGLEYVEVVSHASGRSAGKAMRGAGGLGSSASAGEVREGRPFVRPLAQPARISRAGRSAQCAGQC